MKSELLTLKRITYEDVKNDFFGLLRKQSEGNSELVQVAVCYLEQWRDKAEELLMPLVDTFFIFECKSALEHYSVNLAEAYHRHLEDLIKGKTMEKDKVSTQLSDDERNLQEDCNWLTAFKDQLDTIERG